jgi:hypothetical protein
MKELTPEQVAALIAFLDCFDLYTTGAWAPIEAAMRAEFDIDDPEAALEDVRNALSA